MFDLPRHNLLRLILKLDAAVTGVNGLAYLALAGPLEDLLGVSPDVTRPIGAFLLLFALGVWVIATRPELNRHAVMTVASANAAWAIGSLAFAVSGAASPTTTGTVWIVLQALTVGGFGLLQAAASRPEASSNSAAMSS